MKTSKVHKTSPLPFMGQKRRFLKKFTEVLKSNSPNGIYIDLFGGSGLLSHTVKQMYPDSTVVFNDYDNFSERLAAIDQTNRLIEDLRNLVIDLPKDRAIPSDRRKSLIDRVRHEELSIGYVDYVTVSSNLLFAMNYAHDLETLCRQTFYNGLRDTPYNAKGYLEGVIRESMDYKLLFEKYKEQDNVVFLIDPPYLSTETYPYRSSHWKLGDYLDVLDVLKVPKYYYFTSNKSQVIELCEWLESKVPGANPFNSSVIYSHQTNPSQTSRYTDIMIVK